MGVGSFKGFLDFTVGNKHAADPVNGGAQVALLNADARDGYRVLTSGHNNNAFPSFAPDGKSIVYRTVGPEGQGLRIMSLADHSIRKIDGHLGQFSPSGRLRATALSPLCGSWDAISRIFTTHPDAAGGEKQLTHIRGNHAHLAWLPDGERSGLFHSPPP